MKFFTVATVYLVAGLAHGAALSEKVLGALVSQRVNVPMLIVRSKRSLANHGQCLLCLGLAGRRLPAEPCPC